MAFQPIARRRTGPGPRTPKTDTAQIRVGRRGGLVFAFSPDVVQRANLTNSKVVVLVGTDEDAGLLQFRAAGPGEGGSQWKRGKLYYSFKANPDAHGFKAPESTSDVDFEIDGDAITIDTTDMRPVSVADSDEDEDSGESQRAAA